MASGTLAPHGCRTPEHGDRAPWLQEECAVVASLCRGGGLGDGTGVIDYDYEHEHEHDQGKQELATASLSSQTGKSCSGWDICFNVSIAMDSLAYFASQVFSGLTVYPWKIVGWAGAAIFGSRFVLQWIASERAGKSVVPTAFWVFSIGGGLMLLGYAIYRKDPVFILGQAFGVFVYLRNLQFVMRGDGKGAVA